MFIITLNFCFSLPFPIFRVSFDGFVRGDSLSVRIFRMMGLTGWNGERGRNDIEFVRLAHQNLILKIP